MVMRLARPKSRPEPATESRDRNDADRTESQVGNTLILSGYGEMANTLDRCWNKAPTGRSTLSSCRYWILIFVQSYEMWQMPQIYL